MALETILRMSHHDVSLELASQTFRLESSAGAGGFGSVWKATARDGRAVALKWAHDAAAAPMLAHEAEVAALALSPRLPELADVGWLSVPSTVAAGTELIASTEPGEGKRPFVALSWIEGEPLNARSVRKGHDAVEEALVLAESVAEALADLHGIGTAHGDVKPQNLLVGTDMSVHLIDLGLSCPAFSTELAGATRRYLAVGDAELGDARARDLLALGVVLAERMAASVENADDVVTAARTASLPPPLDEICGALLSRNPTARPSGRWVSSAAERALDQLGSKRIVNRQGERAERDVRAVRAAYLRLRRHELSTATKAAPGTAPWLSSAITLARRARSLVEKGALPAAEARSLGPLPIEGLLRWLVLSCGPHAASWPIHLIAPAGETVFATALIELARREPPEAWSFRDVEQAILSARTGGSESAPAFTARSKLRGLGETTMDAALSAELALAVAAVPPDTLAVEAVEGDRGAPAPLVLAAADALRRLGELGRAKSLVLRESVARTKGAGALAAEVLRHTGEIDEARRIATIAIENDDDDAGRARAVLARLALDSGDIEQARALSADAASAKVAEVAALTLARCGDSARALAEVARGEALCRAPEERARLSAVRGYVLHPTNPEGAFDAFQTAVEYAMRAGAIVEEATYRTGLSASATDLGDLGTAIGAAQRAAVLWEVLARPALAARALLASAAAHVTAGAPHEARVIAEEAARRAREGGDARAEGYARLTLADASPAGDPEAQIAAEEANRLLSGGSLDDALRGAARLFRHGSAKLDAARQRALDESASDPAREVAARLSWWGARAERILVGDADVTTGPLRDDATGVLSALLSLSDARAPVGERGPTLFAGYKLAARLGRSDAAGRLLATCRDVARALLAGTPQELHARARALPWVEPAVSVSADGMRTEQAAELERILRSLADRERLGVLLDRVVDALVLWTGVERGLLLLRAPDGRLVPRAARNLARADLAGEQLALSSTLAQRALEARAPVVAVDAAGELSSVVQSVHVLKLRSVLALPLIARGEVLGVVYLDDRLRKGAFGPRELSWAQTIAQLAAVAILDARQNVLLRRAARKAQRASAELAETLAKREAEVDSLARELSQQRTGRATRHSYDRIIGDSDPIRELLRLADRVTASNIPVLIFGESGSGKELLARAIHDNGERSSRPFVSENCGAIPEGLLESALFGHVRGAFTGADRPRAGLFEVADRGTLFLDEIGEMSLAMQTRLLRVLEDGMIRPVGSDRARKVDVRIVAATHRDLEAMVKARTFREDLYYRLNIIPLRIPPLRARTSDIPLLVQHFVKVHAKGSEVPVTRGALAKLLAYPWPGNVRQLENEVRRALVLCDGVIDVDQLSPEVSGTKGGARLTDGLNVRERIDALEIELVQKALERTRGNQTHAAKLLGLSRFGLQKMMKRLAIGSNADK